MENYQKTPRSTKRIPSETKKVNSDSSSVTRGRSISMISRGFHPPWPALQHAIYRSLIHASATRLRFPVITPSLSPVLLRDCFAATIRLLSEVSYRCGGNPLRPVVLAIGFCFLPTDVLSVVSNVCISPRIPCPTNTITCEPSMNASFPRDLPGSVTATQTARAAVSTGLGKPKNSKRNSVQEHHTILGWILY